MGGTSDGTREGARLGPGPRGGAHDAVFGDGLGPRVWRQALAFAVTLLAAVVHTWPLARDLRTHLAGGVHEDPWMNVWHLDWVRTALLAGKNPFFAAGLHHPVGAELYWHTLVPAKSAWGLVLLPWLGPVASYNFVIFATFLLTGMTSFWLFADVAERRGVAREVAFYAALLGAAVLNFSRYHLCHAVAHMNLASLEGVPLYLLFFFRFLEQGKRGAVVGAALAAGYVALCDFYYVYYLALFSLLWVTLAVWRAAPLLARSTLRSPVVRRALVLGAAVGVACVPAVLPLLLHLRPAALPLHHGDSDYPADPLLLVMPDALSAWQALLPTPVVTALYKLQKGILNDVEGGLFLGAGAPLLAWVALRRGPGAVAPADARALLSIAMVFAVLSLGTHLHLGGQPELPVAVALVAACLWALRSRRLARSPARRDVLTLLALATVASLVLPITAWDKPASFSVPLPYLVFKHVVPLFGRGGMPVRFLLLSQIALAGLVAFGAARFLSSRAAGGGRVLVPFAALFLWLNAETKSVAFPMTPVAPLPAVFERIAGDAPTAAVLTDHVLGQYEQVFHRHPISYARQSRLPVREKSFVDAPVQRALVDFEGLTRDVDASTTQRALREAGYRYVVTHEAAVELTAGRTGAPATQLRDLRRRYIEDVLGATLLHGDRERAVYALP